MEFDLWTEPWLPLQRPDGTMTEVGLAQALGEAGRYRRLVGSTPTMTAALHRLLLALVQRVCRPVDSSRWAQLWEAVDGFPKKELATYQREYASRFDLFHPRMPFFQCPALDITPGSTAKLVAHRATGSNRLLFDHTTAEERPPLRPAEAARWLVTTQTYDTSGTKQPYRTDKSSEGGLGNRFACVLVEGSTLHETLLLNLLPYDPDAEQPRSTTPEDRPVWERPEPPAPEPDSRLSHGWTDLLTWPSRRILLSTTVIEGQTWVDGVALTPGTRLQGELIDYEAMAAYRRPWHKGTSRAGLRPVSLDELRGVWRHSQEFLLSSERRWWNTWKAAQRARGPLPAEEPERQRPAALDNIADRVEDGLIPEETVYTLRVFGQELGSQGGGDTYAWYEEVVPAPVALMRARNVRVGYVIGYAVSLATDLGEALKSMERGYAAEFHRRLTNVQLQLPSNLEIRYWPRLAAPFAEFLRELAGAVRNGTSETESATKWGRTVSHLADQVALQWLEGVPRRNRSLLTGSAHFDDFQRARRKLENVFHGGLAKYTDDTGEARERP